MNCLTAESMVNRYISHTLSLDELEMFLDHIENCSSCYDELETYFIVYAATQKLDVEDEETALDFQTLLKQDIKKARRYVRKKKWIRFLGGVWTWMLLAALIAILLLVILEILHFFNW